MFADELVQGGVLPLTVFVHESTSIMLYLVLINTTNDVTQEKFIVIYSVNTVQHRLSASVATETDPVSDKIRIIRQLIKGPSQCFFR